MAESFSYKNIKQAVFPIERQFHVLKHFGEVDSKYRKYLIENSEYSEEEIDNQIKEKGSMFFKSFVNDPLHLLDVVIKKFRSDGVEAKWMKHRCEIRLSFEKEHFPEGIGEDHIIHIDKLPDEIKNQLPDLHYETLQKLQFIGHHKKTWTVNLIIKKIEDKPVIITIFPGIYAPLLPNHEEQTEEEYHKSMEFWSKHLLIS
jgi:hypothetical protein